jgi:hypothetical protein
VLGFLSLACHAAITEQSFRFIIGEGHPDRPILGVLGWIAAVYALYLAAWVTVRRTTLDQDSQLTHRASTGAPSPLAIIVGFAIAFRVVQVFGNPIQEIDIYRYLWDGRVSLAGINPYRFSPEEVLHEAGGRRMPDNRLRWETAPRSRDGERLAELLAHPAVADIFLTVHHATVPTIYPPLSQGVFVVAAALTPVDLSLDQHLLVMKVLLLLFDLGTMGLLIVLLRTLGKPTSWCLAYAWCPLVIKEVANSGHLDAIAVFFTTLTVLLQVRKRWASAALCWAAAILAKVYPLILFPLFLRHAWLRGGRAALLRLLTITPGILAATYLLLWPQSPASNPVDSAGSSSPFQGLQVFLVEWEMNDLVFHTLYLGVDACLGAETRARIVEQDFWPHRTATASPADRVPIEPAFVLTYVLVALVLGGFVLWWSFRRMNATTSRDSPSVEADRLVEGVFLTLALLFLLGPTANPWYLLWMLTFLPWARLRCWILLPGLVFQYYLRFWFCYHFPEGVTVPGSSRDGLAYFDEVWLWIEYLPFFVVLLLEVMWMRFGNSQGTRVRRD